MHAPDTAVLLDLFLHCAQWSLLALAVPVTHEPLGLLLVLCSMLLMWRSRINPVSLIAVGAVVGAMGWV